MNSYSEHEDRFERSLFIKDEEVTVSIDKPITENFLSQLDNLIEREIANLLSKSISFIQSSKADREIEYIDDLSDPQIMAGSELISVYWYSEKGESKGSSTIGVDFNLDSLEIIELTIGD